MYCCCNSSYLSTKLSDYCTLSPQTHLHTYTPPLNTHAHTLHIALHCFKWIQCYWHHDLHHPDWSLCSGGSPGASNGAEGTGNSVIWYITNVWNRNGSLSLVKPLTCDFRRHVVLASHLLTRMKDWNISVLFGITVEAYKQASHGLKQARAVQSLQYTYCLEMYNYDQYCLEVYN